MVLKYLTLGIYLMNNIDDPIDGLIRYVNEIKPYHSKIIEVLTEYVYDEAINISLSEDVLFNIGLAVNTVDVIQSQLELGGVYDSVRHYDSAPFIPVIAINTTLDATTAAFDETAGLDKKGYNAEASTVALPGDLTATYRVGRDVTVDLVIHDKLTGLDGPPISNTYTILATEFISTGQTNGIADTPHTQLTLSGLVDETQQPPINADQAWSANVILAPIDIVSVVISTAPTTNTARLRYDSIPLLGPGELENEIFIPDIPTEFGDGNVTNLDNRILLSGDVAISYAFGSSIVIILNNGSEARYNITSSYFDGVNTNINLLQELNPDDDYTNARIIEPNFGYSEEYVIPSVSASIIPEGLTQTNIAESIQFSWNDGTEEVINFSQFRIYEIITGNKFVVISDGRIVADIVTIGSTINVVEHNNANGKYTVVSISPAANGTAIEVSNNIEISSDTGFLETT